MEIKFTYNNEEYTYTIQNSIIKIYQVPVEYSSDGLYISDYSKNSIEPYPSSDILNTKLIYHGIVRKVMNTTYMEEVINEIGDVVYA